jgi:hypothetical protein
VGVRIARRFRVGPGLAWLERSVPHLLLAFAVAFNLYQLYPEVAVRAPVLHDGVLHLLAVETTAAALASGQDPTDPWLAPIVMGYPLAHHYQHFAYLPPALLHRLLGGAVPLSEVYNWTVYLLLSLFPLSIYWSMRRFGFEPLAAAFSALVAPLIATDGRLHGLDFSSYVWRGHGLYTQLWGMVLLPPTLAQGYRALRDGRGYLGAVLLLAATTLSHLVFGYLAVGSLALFALLGSGLWTVARRGGRLVLVLALVGLVTAYFLAPLLLDGAFRNSSVWEPRERYDSYGHQWVLSRLVDGTLFDHQRLPLLTALLGVGLALSLWRWRDERYRLAAALFVCWLLLYFGRPTWGALIDLLPMSREMHFHRLIAGLQLGGIMLIGLALAAGWRWASSRRDPRFLLATAGLIGLLLYPAYSERAAYLAANARWMAESRAELAAEAPQIEALLSTLRNLPPGRVYAGLANGWGGGYRVGAVPLYSLLTSAGFDNLGYLYHPYSFNADLQVLFDERRPELYNLFNVRYVVAPRDRRLPEFVQPIAEFGRHRLYRVETSGYFEPVESDTTFAGQKSEFYPAASRWLAGDWPRSRQHPTLQLAGPAPDYQQSFPLGQAANLLSASARPTGEPGGALLGERAEAGRFWAAVRAERDVTLMLKATYHPNWHAYLDGVEVSTRMLMPSYLGISVPPGNHRVYLEYRSQPWRAYLLGLGLATLLLLALARPLAGRVQLRLPVGLATRLPLSRRALEWGRATSAGARGKLISAVERAWRPVPATRTGLATGLGAARPGHVALPTVPRQASWSAAWVWPYGALALLLVLAMWPAWTTAHELVIGGDSFLVHYPYFVLWREALAAGEFPFWNPYTFGGVPAYPTLQAGYSYPPHWLLTWLPAVLALNWTLGLHVLLAGVSAAWCAGRLGAGRDGQFLSGAAYALGSVMVARLWAGHLSFLEANAWLPLATGLAVEVRRPRAVVALALVIALMTFAGQPEILIFSLWWLPLWASLPLLKQGWRPVLEALIRTGLAIGLGFGLAAVLILPAAELHRVSARAAVLTWEMLMLGSLPPWHLLGGLAPWVFGDPKQSYGAGLEWEWHERLLYVGLAPLAAAVLVPGRWRWVCWGLVGLSVALAFGRYVPWYTWFQAVLPGYQSFRVPARHMTLAALALVLAAGLGFERLRGRNVAAGCLAGAALLGLASLTAEHWLPGLAGFLTGAERLGLAQPSAELVSSAVQSLGVAAFLLALVGLAALLPGRWAPRAALALTVAELVMLLGPYRIRPTDPEAFLARAAPLRAYERAAVVGAADWDSALSQFGPLWRVTLPGGYGVFSHDYAVLVTGQARPHFLWVTVSRADDPALPLLGVQRVFQPGLRESMPLEAAKPPVWVARCSWPGGALQVRQAGFPRESCVAVAGSTLREPVVPPGPASLRGRGLNWLTAEATGPGWLVTTIPYYPGWSAEIDGVPATVEVVDGALVGLRLPAGPHLVSLRYRPAGLELGALLSLGTALVLVALWRRDRPGAERRPTWLPI